MISTVHPRETARFDVSQMQALGKTLGAEAAEHVIMRALEDVAVRLHQVQTAKQQHDTAGLRKTAHGLGAVAEQIGLQGVVSVSGHVVHCCETGDPAALAATTARLLRVGEASLDSIWDIGACVT